MIASAGGRLNTSFMGWGVGFFDYDNDGWPDVLIANGHVYPELEAHGVNESYRQRKILYHNRGH
ncbi:MAG TPA: VCBS repeat-containing protein, partial [Terriglobia bacterium]|nr:VCBS repeat-containing protein [Terriglobia bacterium]